MTETRTPTDGPFRLFDLPLELRNIIYEFVVTTGIIDPTNISVVTYRTPPKRCPITFHLPGDKDWSTADQSDIPPLLRTCRQIRLEASKVYYSGNTFIIRPRYDPPLNSTYRWLKSREPEACSWMRKILVLSPACCRCVKWHGTLKVLINLKKGDIKWFEQKGRERCCQQPDQLALRTNKIRNIIEEANSSGGITWEDINAIGMCIRREIPPRG